MGSCKLQRSMQKLKLDRICAVCVETEWMIPLAELVKIYVYTRIQKRKQSSDLRMIIMIFIGLIRSREISIDFRPLFIPVSIKFDGFLSPVLSFFPHVNSIQPFRAFVYIFYLSNSNESYSASYPQVYPSWFSETIKYNPFPCTEREKKLKSFSPNSRQQWKIFYYSIINQKQVEYNHKFSMLKIKRTLLFKARICVITFCKWYCDTVRVS